MTLGLKFRLEGLYFTTFRRPASTSLITSYSIPPYTTIRGIIANALGLKRDDLSVQDWVKIGINPLSFSDKSQEMAKILKLTGEGVGYQRTFPSSPMFREFLVFPAYDIYLVGDEEKISTIHKALVYPARPLYIGTSDDLADVSVSNPVEVEETSANEVSGVVEGIHEKCFVEKVPYKFTKNGKRFSLDYKTLSIPQTGVVKLNKKTSACQFKDEFIQLN